MQLAVAKRPSWSALASAVMWITACGSQFHSTGAEAGASGGAGPEESDARAGGAGGRLGTGGGSSSGGAGAAASGGATATGGVGGSATRPLRDAAVDAIPPDAQVDASFDAQPAGSRYRGAVLADGPLVYWRMNVRSGRSVPDVTGGGNDLVLQGTGHQLGVAGAIAGDDDRAIEFDGEASFAIATDPRALDFAGGAPFTLECWSRRKSGGSSYFQHLISNLEGNPGDRNGYILYLLPEPGGQDNARTVFEYDYSATDNGYWGPLPDESKWSHVAAVYDGAKATLYVDGTLADSGLTGGGFVARTGPFAVARSSQASGSFFKGALDEIAVYPRALGAADIARHVALAQ